MLGRLKVPDDAVLGLLALPGAWAVQSSPSHISRRNLQEFLDECVQSAAGKLGGSPRRGRAAGAIQLQALPEGRAALVVIAV
eukprot:8869706-Lingulodinium_polyedra.AAC.1